MNRWASHVQPGDDAQDAQTFSQLRQRVLSAMASEDRRIRSLHRDWKKDRRDHAHPFLSRFLLERTDVSLAADHVVLVSQRKRGYMK